MGGAKTCKLGVDSGSILEFLHIFSNGVFPEPSLFLSI